MDKNNNTQIKLLFENMIIFSNKQIDVYNIHHAVIYNLIIFNDLLFNMKIKHSKDSIFYFIVKYSNGVDNRNDFINDLYEILLELDYIIINDDNINYETYNDLNHVITKLYINMNYIVSLFKNI